MSNLSSGEAGIVQHESQPGINQDQINVATLESTNQHPNKLLAFVTAVTAVGALLVGQAAEEQPAYASTPAEVTVGAPFQGKWAADKKVIPPYTDTNSSHPSVHNAYSFQLALDYYGAKDTEVRAHGSSPQGEVTFKRTATSDTCSSYGADIAGKGITLDALVNGTKVGELKYDHLDLVDVGDAPFASGTKIGEITSEPKHASCYQVDHTHIQFKNTTNQSCYIDHGETGQVLNAGTALGILGSINTVAKQACTESGGGGGSGNPAPPAWAVADLYEIHNWGAPNGVTDIKELPAAGSYQQWGNGYPTNDSWHPGPDVDYGMGDFNGDNVQDIIKIQHQSTASGMTEARVFNGADQFTAGNSLVTPDGHHGSNDVDYVVADYNRDGRPDIYRIMHWNTGSGKTEIRVLNGATNYSTWLTDTFVTPDGWHGGDDIDYAASTCGTTNHPNVFAILHRNTRNGMTEVKRLDGNMNYTNWNGGWDTIDGEHSSDDVNYVAGDCNQNTGLPNIYAVLHKNTATGQTEVKRMDGSIGGLPFSRWNGGWNTPDVEHSSHDVDFVMAQRNN